MTLKPADRWKLQKRDGIAVKASPAFVAAMDAADKAGSSPETKVKNVTFSVASREPFSELAEDLQNLEKRVIQKAVQVRFAELNDIEKQLDSQLYALKAKERRY